MLHTRGSYDVAIAGGADAVRIDVVDTRPELLPIALPSAGAAAALVEDSVTGRGLRLVSSLALRWGYTTTATTKSVWVELGEGHGRPTRWWSGATRSLAEGTRSSSTYDNMPYSQLIGSGRGRGAGPELQLASSMRSLGPRANAPISSPSSTAARRRCSLVATRRSGGGRRESRFD